MSDEGRFFPLPDDVNGRLHLLRLHVDAIEALGMSLSSSEKHESLLVALKRVKTRSPLLRADQRLWLEQLYDELRRREKAGPK